MVSELKKYKVINIVCAHPDAEIIFFGPFLNSSLFNNSRKCLVNVYCLTCKDHTVRSKEFALFMDSLSVNYKIYDYKIVRGMNFFNIYRYYRWIKNNVNTLSNQTLFVTHSIYGDDHFHPQHIFLSIATLLYVRIYRYDVLFSNNLLFANTFYKSSFYSSNQNLIFKYLKLFLMLLSRIIYKKSFFMSCRKSTIKKSISCYKSQNLSYNTLIENKFHFSEFRL